MESVKDIVDSISGQILTTPLPLEMLSRLTEYPVNPQCFNFPISDAELLEFYQLHLCKLLNQLFLTYLTKENIVPTSLIERIVRKGKSDVVFRCLVTRLCDKSNGSMKLDLLVKLLEAFILKHRNLSSVLQLVLSEQSVCCVNKRYLDEFARSVITLPSHLANVSRGLLDSKLFDRSIFVNSVLSAFSFSDNASNLSKFCGVVLSHLMLSGYASEAVQFLISQVGSLSLQNPSKESDNFWSISCCALKEECIEPFIVALLKDSPHPRYVEVILKSILREPSKPIANSFIKVFRRLLFVRYFPNGFLLRNLFGALSEIVRNHINASDCEYLFEKVNSELGYPCLQLWADVSSIQKTSVEQRLYISQSLVSWLMDFYLSLKDLSCFTTSTLVLLPEVLSGISNHLSSPRADIRMLGMVVGEWLIRMFPLPANSKEDCTLKFDYEETEYVRKIKPFFESIQPLDTKKKIESSKLIQKDHEDTDNVDIGEGPSTNMILDSDDDSDMESQILNPLPKRIGRENGMNTVESRFRKPRYLRECLDGMLMNKPEDSEIGVACYFAAAELIRAHPEAAKELVYDFARILVHVQPPPSPNEAALATQQHAALVALGVVAPKECSRYLTHEFSQVTCSFGERLRILSAITDIAHELSGSWLTSNKDPKTVLTSNNLAPNAENTASSGFLTGKTRRFCSSPRIQMQTTNAFAPVAGDFFFPLLNSISQLHCVSQRGVFAHQDAAVLSNVIATMGTIYACARLSPVQMRMANEFVELLPILYRHKEPAVRQASLITLGTIITTTPSMLLSSNPALLFSGVTCRTSHNYPFNLIQWLERCATDDSDTECRVLASVGLSALMERALEFSAE